MSGSTGDGPDYNTVRPSRPDMATHPGRDGPKIPLGAEVDDLGEALEVFGRVGAELGLR